MTMTSRKMPAIRRKAQDLDGLDLVELTTLGDPDGLPLIITPRVEQVDVFAWIAANRDFLDRRILVHGGVVLRGFGMGDQNDFERALDAFGMKRCEYIENATPRRTLGERVYTSTEYPPEYPIALHNELSYVRRWPMRISLFSVIPAATGGESPIADMRRVYERLDPAIRDDFERRGWQLIRNFGSGFGPPWQRSFHTERRDEVEDYCRQNDITWEWREEGRLRTRQTRPAVRRHPVTGEKVWFNHMAFWHPSSLPAEIRARFESDFGEGNFPYSTCYGDGAPIPDAVVAEVRRIQDEETIVIPYQTGDMIMLDNMLAAHARSTFTGRRLTLVSMGDVIGEGVEC